MSYPIKLTQGLPVGQSISLPFMPEKAGLVKAILSATWLASETPPPDDGNLPPGEAPLLRSTR